MAISAQLFPPMVQMAILVQNSSSKETFYENMDKIRRVEEGSGGWGGGGRGLIKFGSVSMLRVHELQSFPPFSSALHMYFSTMQFACAHKDPNLVHKLM